MLRLPAPKLVGFFFGSLLASTQVCAQWIGYPTADVPRRADGSVDMHAPAPRTADGKPDLSGLWIADTTPEGEETRSDAHGLSSGREMRDMGVDMEGGLPYQPWLVPIVAEHRENLAINDPHIRCLPDNFLRACRDSRRRARCRRWRRRFGGFLRRQRFGHGFARLRQFLRRPLAGKGERRPQPVILPEHLHRAALAIELDALQIGTERQRIGHALDVHRD